METNYIKFKFNGGNGAVLCSNCAKIIMSGRQIPEYIWDAVSKHNGEIQKIPPMFCCDKCKEEYYKKKVEKK